MTRVTVATARRGPRGLASPGVRLAALIAILALGAFFRFSGLNWDDGSQPHPDERYMSQVASALHSGELVPAGHDAAAREAHRAECQARHPATKGVGDWFDTRCSDLNPANAGYPGYPYGQLPLVAVRYLAELAAAATDWVDAARYDGIAMVGRVFSGAVELATIVAIVLLGRLLWGLRTGLLAALLYALAVHAIQVAHFWTVDPAATLLATWALLFLVRLARFARLGDALAFGVAFGLAMASKISVLPLVLLLPVAALLAPSTVRFAAPPSWTARGALALPAVLLALIAAAATYRLASPYSFSGPGLLDFGLSDAFVEQVAVSRRLASGAVDVPPNWQWLIRMAWVTPGRDMLVWGLGPLAGAAALVGFGVAGLRLLRAATPMQRARALVWCWVAGYFFWMGQQWVASMRYFLPIYPALCLLAAGWLVPAWRGRRLVRRAAGQAGGAARQGEGAAWQVEGARVLARGSTRALAGLAIVLVIGSSLLWALAFWPVHTTLHPYVAATHWILRHVPAGVSGALPDTDGTVLINWPVAGRFGDGVAAAVAARTQAPVGGTIERLRLHRLELERSVGGGAPVRLRLRLLDADGRTLAETAPEPLPFSRDAAARPRLAGIELPLLQPAALQAGALYQLQVEVDGGVVELSGAAIAHEGPWNDAVPTRVPWLPPTLALNDRTPSGTTSRFAPKLDAFAERYYRGLDLLMVGDDDEAKRQRLLDVLDDSEWLVVPNNRFYAAMQWNPLRFPLSIAFYDALFDGSLGFERHRVVSSMPRLAGLTIADQVLPRDGEGVTPRRGAMAWAPEEAFSVYDHPTVFVFRKTHDYARERAERIFAPLDLATVDQALQAPPQTAGRLTWSTYDARGAPDGLLLAAAETAAPLHPADAHEAFPRGTLQMIAAVLLWYLCSLVLGLIAWAWLAPACAGLADRGYGISRVMGLVLPASLAWLLAQHGVAAWSRSGLLLLSLLLALPLLCAAMPAVMRRSAILPGSGRTVLRVEAVFLALFALGLLLRLFDPDLWAPALGGEKPMEYALLNAILNGTTFPPHDPWFSGGRVNYYYFGWVLAGVLIKLTGVAPGVAFNLALPTWFAMTGTAVAALVWNVCRLAAPRIGSRAAAIGAVAALAAAVLAGNLDGPRAWWPGVSAAAAALRDDAGTAIDARRALLAGAEGWYWSPSRTVAQRAGGGTEINEFPAFTFLYGDLHPHLLAMPLQLALLTLMLALIFAPLASPALSTTSPGFWSKPSSRLPPALRRLAACLLWTGIGIAVLRMTNSWDWPTYLLLGLAAAALAGWRLAPLRHWPPAAPVAGFERWLQAVACAAALFVVQWLAAWPFSAQFATGAVGLTFYSGPRTALSSWLLMHGWFVLVLVLWGWRLSRAELATADSAVPAAAARPVSPRMRGLLRLLHGLSALGLAYTLAALLWHWRVPEATVPAFGLQLALLAWLLALACRCREAAARVGLLAGAAGIAIAFGVEWVVVGQDLGRMNTFFKFHLQSWLLLAVAAGIAVAHLAAAAMQAIPAIPAIPASPARPTARAARRALILIIIVAVPALAYLPLGVVGRMQSRFDASAPWTLDGEAFLQYARLSAGDATIALAGDAQLIAWLRRNAAPRDVILEAQLPEYRWGSRIASFTGRPTLLGYRHHQAQQRPLPALGNAIELRRRNVAALYESTDAARAVAVLKRYGVRFIVVGALERAVYPAAGLDKFAALARGGTLRVAFSAGDDRIYELPGAAPGSPAW